MLPHDYNDYEMRLHSFGNSRPYLEKDFVAREADDQLPLLSTVGLGPTGPGVYVANVTNGTGEFSFDLVDDEGNVLASSENLSPGEFSFTSSGNTVSIIKTRGGVSTVDATFPLPRGDRGSLFWLSEQPVEPAELTEIPFNMITGPQLQPALGDVVIAPSYGGVTFCSIIGIGSGEISVVGSFSTMVPGGPVPNIL